MMTFDPWSRWAIESSIAAAGRNAARQASANADHLGGRIDALAKNMQSQSAELRMDMIEGLGEVSKEIAASGERTSAQLVRIERDGIATQQALVGIHSTLSVVSDNVRIGFTKVIERLEEMQGSLDRIEQGVMNPEETRALERYRRAKTMLERGRTEEAMQNIEAAIANDGGPVLNDIPELFALRGLMHLGAYDTDEVQYLNPFKALEDFGVAREFTTGKSAQMVDGQIAFTHTLMQNHDPALKIYKQLVSDTEDDIDDAECNALKFQQARCLLQVSQIAPARALIKDVFSRDWRYAIEAAADPTCQDHAKMFAQVVEEVTEEARDLCADVVSTLNEASPTTLIRETKKKALAIFDEAQDVSDIVKKWKTSPRERLGGQVKYDVGFHPHRIRKIGDIDEELKALHAKVQETDAKVATVAEAGALDLREILTREVELARKRLAQIGDCEEISKEFERVFRPKTRNRGLSDTLVLSVKTSFRKHSPQEFMPERPSGFVAGRLFDRKSQKMQEKARQQAANLNDEIDKEMTRREMGLARFINDEKGPSVALLFDDLAAHTKDMTAKRVKLQRDIRMGEDLIAVLPENAPRTRRSEPLHTFARGRDAHPSP